MKVWVDQDLCTGDGLCEELSPTVFQMEEGLSYVRDSRGALMMSGGMVEIPELEMNAVLDAAEECPGECIFIEY
jgi:ferredoxin